MVRKSVDAATARQSRLPELYAMLSLGYEPSWTTAHDATDAEYPDLHMQTSEALHTWSLPVHSAVVDQLVLSVPVGWLVGSPVGAIEGCA